RSSRRATRAASRTRAGANWCGSRDWARDWPQRTCVLMLQRQADFRRRGMIRGELQCRIESAGERMSLPADGPVAQLDRASDFGSEGWGFDSLRGRHSKSRFADPAEIPANDAPDHP